MALERLLREQVYKYKRRQYLRKSNENKINVSQFMIFNVNKTILNKFSTKEERQGINRGTSNKFIASTRPNRRTTHRPSRGSSFYGSPMREIGGRQIAGLICMILAVILICTQCFNVNAQEAVVIEKISSYQMQENAMGKDEIIADKKIQKEPSKEETVNKEIGTKKKTSTLESYYESIQNVAIEKKNLKKLFNIADKNQREYSQALAIWFLEKVNESTDNTIYGLIKKYNHEYMLKNYPCYEQGESIYRQFAADIKYFPIAKYKKYNLKMSWQAKGLFEETDSYGIDIIDPNNKTGKTPVVSMTDGVIEGFGWHEVGGYRIGIRSTGGAYFYYGHLDELPTHLQKGDRVQAGDYLGMMGNTGYGTEGTRGEIPVKLHIGIAVGTKEGKQFWINPYPFLQYIEGNRAVIRP